MPESGIHVLVVDDDSRLRDLLKKFLTRNGYWVTTVANVPEAHEAMRYFFFDLIILDVMLPGEDGRSFARSLRVKGDTVPVLMLTAMGEVEDRISGFEHGVDDYLAKPFEPRELLLRIGSILKRTAVKEIKEEPVQFGEWKFDVHTEVLYAGAEIFPLTDTEKRLLSYLITHRNRTVPRQDLQKELGDTASVSMVQERSVDVTINRLRQKIEPDPKKPLFIQTVWGKGYVFRM